MGGVCAPTLQTSVKFRDFKEIYLCYFFNKSFSNLVPNFKGALSSGVDGFSLTWRSVKLKENRGKVDSRACLVVFVVCK